MKKIIFPVILTAALTSAVTFWGFRHFAENQPFFSGNDHIPVHYASVAAESSTQPVDFSSAAESSVKSVVHIMTLTQGRTIIARDPYDPFGAFGRAFQTPNQMGSGSGVIISPDGYIVTNNHVVQGADKVQVTFNDRNTEIAKVIGTDPATDLAVIKIDGKDLPYMTLGNSDNVKLGQWVLAVGYPLDLDCTVTAGIVSAKGRSIGINHTRSRDAIEAFIQTDAAVNPGNSGGALVNVAGQLIGINSAIASPTGSYAGYSYAIPSNLVEKVANDIIKYGKVERGYLGVELFDLDKMNLKTAEQLGISKEDFRNTKGVYIHNVTPNSGAAEAGLKKGDFITMINGVAINSQPELTEQVARYHPGDKISLTYRRGDNDYKTSVELKNYAGAISVGETKGTVNILGASMRNITSEEARKLHLTGGVMVTDLGNGILQQETNIKPGFVIFSINEQPVANTTDAQNLLNQTEDNLQIAGVYPGRNGIYYYGLRNEDGNAAGY